MDLKGVDLNLLPVLDALLRQRSATRAARELDMSQSTLSSALGRLRQQLGDELFVRTGRGLRPTSRAAALAGPVADILDRVRDQVLATRDGNAMAVTLLSSDMGKLYVALAQAIERLRD